MKKAETGTVTRIEFVTYDAKFLEQFIELNFEWIQKHFVVEPMDVAQLEQAQKQILDPGGEIFFLLENGVPCATCAMVVHGERCYELAKMAVKSEARRRGYGDLLMLGVLNWARKQRAEKVILLSNTILEPAMRLYQKHGFETVHLGKHPDYERCNIVMEIKI